MSWQSIQENGPQRLGWKIITARRKENEVNQSALRVFLLNFPSFPLLKNSFQGGIPWPARPTSSPGFHRHLTGQILFLIDGRHRALTGVP